MKYNKVIEGCIRGEASYQRELVRGFAPTFKAIGLRYLPDEPSASDAVQEAFINVFRYIHTYKHEGSFEGWMRRIAVNASLNYRKKHFKQRPFEELDHHEKSSFTLPEAVMKLDHEELLKLIKQLPDQYYLVFSMNVIEGFSHKEIAETLGITDSTSRATLTRARKKLKNLLGLENQAQLQSTEKQAI